LLLFRLIALAGLLFSLLLVAAVALIGYWLIEGGGDPPSCAPAPGNAFESAARSLAFDAKLATFLVANAREQDTSASFGEDEAAARAANYFEGRSDRVSDVRVCFERGSAEGFMNVDVIFGRSIGVSARGDIDLTGEHPRVDLSSASAAGVGLPTPLRDRVEDLINDELAGLRVLMPLQLAFEPDEARLTVR
jgi:hypothetical protein